MSISHLRSVDSEYLLSEEYQFAKATALPPKRTSRRRLTLMRAINVIFILVASFSIICSPILGNVLNIHIGVSSYDYGDAGVHHGDLLILKDEKLSQIGVGNVVLVHPLAGVSGELLLGSVTGTHANPNQVDISVTKSSYKAGAIESDALGTEIRVVTRVFPKMGYLLNFFTSISVKVGFLFLVGIVNLLAYMSMRRAANSNAP